MGKVVYRVNMIESERGWGQKYWHEDFDTYAAAKWHIHQTNSRNPPGRAPDFYIMAETEIKCVEV